MLCRIETRRFCTDFGSRRAGKAPFACRSAQRTALANWITWRASLSLELLGLPRAGRRDVVLLLTQPARPYPARAVPPPGDKGRRGRDNSARALQATTSLRRGLAYGQNRSIGSYPTRRSCQVHLAVGQLESLERLNLFMLALGERHRLRQGVLPEMKAVLLGVNLQVLG